MYPQISFPDLKYQLEFFDVVVDIVDIDVYVNIDDDVDVNVLEEKWGEGPRCVFLILFWHPPQKCLCVDKKWKCAMENCP